MYKENRWYCIIPKLLPPRKINARFSFLIEAESKKDKMDYREMEKGERSVYRIAKLQNVTPRW